MKKFLMIVGILLITAAASYADIIFENRTDRVLDIYVTDGTNQARSYTITTADKITIPARNGGKIDIKYAGSKYNKDVLETVKHSGNERITVTTDKDGKIKVKKIRKHW